MRSQGNGPRSNLRQVDKAGWVEEAGREAPIRPHYADRMITKVTPRIQGRRLRVPRGRGENRLPEGFSQRRPDFSAETDEIPWPVSGVIRLHAGA